MYYCRHHRLHHSPPDVTSADGGGTSLHMCVWGSFVYSYTRGK